MDGFFRIEKSAVNSPSVGRSARSLHAQAGVFNRGSVSEGIGGDGGAAGGRGTSHTARLKYTEAWYRSHYCSHLPPQHRTILK